MTWDQVQLLRLYINDPKTGTELFHDPQLEDFITKNEDDLYAAASEIWGIKAATVTDWYQLNMDGSFMRREQVFEHCIAMQKHYQQYRTMISVPVDSGYDDAPASSEF